MYQQPPPQAQGYPAPPQQGYQQPPPQAQGYPPPQQGYQQNAPPPQQGYPPPQQGYPPPQQGYQQNAPPPQQGYPPSQQGQAPPPPQQQGYQPNAPVAAAPLQQAPPPPQSGQVPPPQQGQAPSQLPNPPLGADNVDLPGGTDEKDENGIGDEDKGDIPVDSMEAVTGYDAMDSMIPPPPVYEEYVEPPPPDFTAQMPMVKDEEAREALVSHAAENCCWGTKAAKELTFSNIDHSAAFHYVLETFSESRKTNWASEPYVGQSIDSPYNGPAPVPWSITVQNPPMFQDTVIYQEVPHTATVKPCHDCRATGYRRCHNCYGRGTTRCNYCDGRGRRAVSRYDGDRHYTDYEHCSWCGGDGRRRCSRCSGTGRIVCITCNANGQLKCYIRLTVEWKNHVEDHIVERTNLPDELVRGVSGEQVFQEEHPKVWPIKGFPINDVNTGSSMLVQRHTLAYNRERLHMQRHQIRVIPVAEAKCTFKDETFTYFVYGFERKVHAPEYPQQCCWGCSIL
eukprot:XP_011681998.1 PREDICTED: protein SSUH2 homolog isoform X2 [Strongylocentrotus purpuratus]